MGDNFSSFYGFLLAARWLAALARPASSMGRRRGHRHGVAALAWRKKLREPAKPPSGSLGGLREPAKPPTEQRVRFAEEIQQVQVFEVCVQSHPPGGTANSESTEGRSQLDPCLPSAFPRCCYPSRGQQSKVAISGMHPTRAGPRCGACLVAHIAGQIPGGCHQTTRSADRELQEYAECRSCARGVASRLRGSHFDKGQQIYIAAYGNKFHVRADCEVLRAASYTMSATVCGCCNWGAVYYSFNLGSN